MSGFTPFEGEVNQVGAFIVGPDDRLARLGHDGDRAGQASTTHVSVADRDGESAWRRGQRAFGRFILRLAPWLMKSLGVLGTTAMFLVGGGILVHGIPPVYDVLHHVQELAHGAAALGGLLSTLTMLLYNAVFGILAGGLVLAVVRLIGRLRGERED